RERRLVHRLPAGLRLDARAARPGRPRLPAGAGRRRALRARRLLRRSALPALLRVDADRRRGVGRCLRRRAHRDAHGGDPPGGGGGGGWFGRGGAGGGRGGGGVGGGGGGGQLRGGGVVAGRLGRGGVASRRSVRVVLVQRFVLEERRGEAVELAAVRGQHLKH